MTTNTKSDVSGYQRERLSHIDFMVYFTGKVTRKDLMARFDLSQAVATRDLTLYRELAPKNLVYDTSAKQYVIADHFTPLYEMSPFKCLSTLSEGFGDSLKTESEFKVAYAKKLREPRLDLVATVTRAISLGNPLIIRYFSKSSKGAADRVIVPHSIVDSGLRWHVRAYDRDKKRFADFVINRIFSATEVAGGKAYPSETLEYDQEWLEEVDLVLQPHPSKSDVREIIELELGMIDGIFTQRVKKALVGYMLDSWNVDATPDAGLLGNHVMLHLKNAKEIAEMKIKNFHLAPSN